MPELALIFLPTFIFIPSIRCLYCLKGQEYGLPWDDFHKLFSKIFSNPPAGLAGWESKWAEAALSNEWASEGVWRSSLGFYLFFFFSQWLSFSFRLPSLVSSRCPHFLLRSSFALFESWHLAWARMRDRGGRAVGGGPTGWAQGSGTQMQAETSKRTYSVFFCS